MKRKKLLLVLLAAVLNVYSWNSDLYPEDWAPPATESSFYTDKIIQDFSYAGYMRGDVLPPDIQGPVYDVTQDPYNADNTGGSDAAVAIQSAIDAAGSAGGGVVYLPAGTYRISPQNGNSYALSLEYSDVVIRGAGAGQTFIINTETSMRGKDVIRVSGSGGGWTTVPSGSPVGYFAADIMGPSREIPLNDASSFSAEDWVILRSDITEEWIDEHNEDGWSGYSSSFPGIIYLRRIDSVDYSDNSIYVDIPLRYAMKTRDNARVYMAPDMIEAIGLEGFSIANMQNNKDGWAEDDYNVQGTGAYDVHPCYVLSLSGVRDSWVRNVETFNPGNSSTAHILSNGILFYQCRGISVESCYFQRPQYGGAGGNGYMYRVQAQENRFADTKAEFARHGFVLSHMYASGNVFLRCTDKDGGRQTGLSGGMNTVGSGSDHHMHFSHSNLFDDCTAENSILQAAYRPWGSDPKHNLTAAHSVYWRIKGLGSWSNSIHSQQARYGYVIGTWGTVTSVNTSPVGNSSYKTDPVDHTEGLGQGESLTPQSLSLDQLERRLESSTSAAGEVSPQRRGADNLTNGANKKPETFFSVHYMPGRTAVELSAGLSGPVSLDVYNIAGRTVYRFRGEKEGPETMRIPLLGGEMLPAGVYTVHCTLSGAVVVRRIFIK